MKIVIRKLTPAGIKAERAKLLRKAQVTSVLALRRKVKRLEASPEQQGIMLRLDGLSFIEGATPKVR